MKKIDLIKYLGCCILTSLIILVGCKEPITDFGYNATLEGTVLNQDGDIVSGDITSGALVVHALGERGKSSMRLRVKGDGTYKNSKLYPQSYSVWLEGPFLESPTEEVSVDLTGNKEASYDFEITPFIVCSTPELEGSPSASGLTVNYSISGNGGYIPEDIEVLCSTVSYPTTTTESGAGFTTITKSISNDQGNENLEGTVEFSELESGTKYFIRIGARAKEADSWNYSDQISVSVQ